MKERLETGAGCCWCLSASMSVSVLWQGTFPNREMLLAFKVVSTLQFSPTMYVFNYVDHGNCSLECKMHKGWEVKWVK